MHFTKTLTNWYSVNKRDLPWRNTKNPYYIWLSEIILQQTQIKQGLPYYEAFVAQYPTVFDLANANEEAVLKLWQGLGYYSRARNLHATAKYVAVNLNGNFPDNYTDLLKLKGIGDYTASAIASFCFNEVAAVVDGNVYRVLARFYGIHIPINSTEGKKVFKALATDIIDAKNPADFNQAIMEFGAIQCKPSSPDCSVCPLKEGCIAFRKNEISVLPIKIKNNKPKNKFFNFLVYVTNDGQTILEKRKGKGIWQNLYQFPLLESKHSLDEASFLQQLNPDDSVENVTLFNAVDIIHKLSHQHLHTKFWIIQTANLPKTGIPVSEIENYAVPILIKNFIDAFNFQSEI
ncbi:MULTISPECIES: A/G-specific adenine glycosylase [Bizionia]|uniref:Adenine DNA glycosylase n=1 Tax=Bizionia algoritergicola TaxID=291187 RepID=A0A5D0QZZ6_9FLAO|nr:MULTISPECIES: A/G-specific adenine glycosylase [Bizionia]OBX21813.1 A/G-specific adenine glycosylase [Bizionia sp. APA-3]TYB74840.1 A/G-specific adenine glycosylase [Bizionia algoritergicola]